MTRKLLFVDYFLDLFDFLSADRGTAIAGIPTDRENENEIATESIAIENVNAIKTEIVNETVNANANVIAIAIETNTEIAITIENVCVIAIEIMIVPMLIVEIVIEIETATAIEIMNVLHVIETSVQIKIWCVKKKRKRSSKNNANENGLHENVKPVIRWASCLVGSMLICRHIIGRFLIYFKKFLPPNSSVSLLTNLETFLAHLIADRQNLRVGVWPVFGSYSRFCLESKRKIFSALQNLPPVRTR